MKSAPRSFARSHIALGLAGLVLCFGCSSSESSGGNAGTGGMSSNHAGAAGATSGGASSGGHSSGGASSGGHSSGGASSGGHSSGGASSGGHSSAGAAGKGTGDPSCEIVDCLIANHCVDYCGGPITYTGCCPCLPPELNQNTCGGASSF